MFVHWGIQLTLLTCLYTGEYNLQCWHICTLGNTIYSVDMFVHWVIQLTVLTCLYIGEYNLQCWHVCTLGNTTCISTCSPIRSWAWAIAACVEVKFPLQHFIKLSPAFPCFFLIQILFSLSHRVHWFFDLQKSSFSVSIKTNSWLLD